MNRIFIVGSPRSGTTLLQQIIIANFKNIYTFPETHFFSIANPINPIKKVLGWKNLYLQGYMKKLAKQLDMEYAQNYKVSLFGRDYHEGLVNLLDDVAKKHGVENWIEKTPRHLHFIDDIKNIENSKFIHIVRNGEEMVASLYDATNSYAKEWVNKDKTRFKGFTIDQCINKYNMDLEITSKYIYDNRHLVLFYEDIVSDSNTVIKKISKFLNLQISESSISLSETAEAVVEKHEHWKSNNKSDVLKNRSKFLSVFSSDEQNYILSKINSKLYEELYNTIDKNIENLL